MHLEMLSLMIMAVKLWRTADFLSDNRYGGHLRVVVYCQARSIKVRFPSVEILWLHLWMLSVVVCCRCCPPWHHSSFLYVYFWGFLCAWFHVWPVRLEIHPLVENVSIYLRVGASNRSLVYSGGCSERCSFFSLLFSAVVFISIFDDCPL